MNNHVSSSSHRRAFPKIVTLAAGVTCILSSAQAQNYAVLKHFSPLALNPAIGSYTNADGDYPQADLIFSGQTLYGTAMGGGTNGSGTVFKINFDGSGFTVLHHFAPGTTNATGTFTNSDGQQPQSRLILSDDTLFGTATYGGLYGGGTVFRLDTNGNHFTVLKQFLPGGPDGAYPYTGVLVPGGNVIIGETGLGGPGGGGTVFRMGTNGNTFVLIHQFDFSPTNGSQPYGTLLRSGNTLFGTTYSGGTNGYGTVFKMNTNGGNFTLLKSFSAPVAETNSDGLQPRARLILSGAVLYGTTYAGGASNGIVFRVNTDSTGFTNLHSFGPTTNIFGSDYNADGAHPVSRLVLAGDTLYGTTQFGSFGAGNIFSLGTDGSNFLQLRPFAVTSPYDGRVPAAGLALSGATFFGTTEFGGSNSTGTIFSYRWDNTPPITITASETNVLLSWPTDTGTNANNFNFTLQSTPVLGSSAVWSDVTNAPGFNPFTYIGWNFVTNVASDPARFYRLSPY